MKNKKLTYLLLPLVILIWGMIIYRVMAASGADDPSRSESLQNMVPPVVRNDTFSISGDYRDPFRTEPARSMSAHTDSPLTAPPAREKNPVQVIQNSWPRVAYGGTIRNQQSKKELAMVEIDGQNNFMKQGDRIKDVQLLKVFRDSILVSYGKEKKTIHK